MEQPPSQLCPGNSKNRSGLLTAPPPRQENQNNHSQRESFDSFPTHVSPQSPILVDASSPTGPFVSPLPDASTSLSLPSSSPSSFPPWKLGRKMYAAPPANSAALETVHHASPVRLSWSLPVVGVQGVRGYRSVRLPARLRGGGEKETEKLLKRELQLSWLPILSSGGMVIAVKWL